MMKKWAKRARSVYSVLMGMLMGVVEEGVKVGERV